MHVFDTGLARAVSDERIWEFACANDFTSVTADSDFVELSQSRGAPPKVVQLVKCDYRTSRVEEVLRRHAVLIADLKSSERAILLIRN